MARAGRSTPLLIAVALAAFGVGCSSSSAKPASCTDAVSTSTVTLADFSFTPACTAATAGATLTITNAGALPHTFTVSGTSVNVLVQNGETKDLPLTGLAPGTYPVVCSLHPQMTGSLKIG